MTFAVSFAATLLSASLALVAVRLFRGPTLPDRAVALDLVAYVVIGLMALTTLTTGERAYLDAAMGLALLGFLATIGFARHVTRGSR